MLIGQTRRWREDKGNKQVIVLKTILYSSYSNFFYENLILSFLKKIPSPFFGKVSSFVFLFLKDVLCSTQDV